MAVIPAFGDPPPAAAVAAAARALGAGQIVGIPTDTVYGLAADALHTGASDRLFSIKGRPRSVDLPVLVSDMDQALTLVEGISREARAIAERLWPGALTLVLPRRPDLRADLGSDDATIGVRCPGHPVPRELCRQIGPLATTSANRHGQPDLSTAEELDATFGEALAVVLDGGVCAGSPSTVADCTGPPRCLREGRIPWEEVLAAAG